LVHPRAPGFNPPFPVDFLPCQGLLLRGCRSSDSRCRSSVFQHSSDPDKTLIYAWDKPISVRQLQLVLRTSAQSALESSLELLVLTGCQTATGDRRAELGMAGVGIQSGARSTLASLWNVDDRSTALAMQDFYSSLVKGQSKAASLQQAQLKLLQSQNYRHPYYWAPWVLLGSWL
nr:CHAT domain-containing protein [Aphanocapsa sp. GSE-SYN-MK-11-07L]